MRSVARVQIPVSPPNKTDKQTRLSVFVFRYLTTGILHDAEHRAACGVNPGSQASVTIIRSLALNEIGTRDALSLIIFCLLSVSILA